MASALVVKVTVGAEQPERSNQGLMVAATAASSGVEVSLWLAGEAAWFAVPDRPTFDLPLATPIRELIDVVRESGTVTVCAQCAARRQLTPADLLPGVRIAGAAAYVEEILRPEAQAIVY
ncbi:MAG TPA: DsrE family protein [Nocardioides sp.]|nr:DsrE family protein [Nocardioides sp.]